MPEAALYSNGINPMIAGGMMTIIIVIAIRDAIWKAIALRKAGRGNQLTRFIFFLYSIQLEYYLFYT